MTSAKTGGKGKTGIRGGVGARLPLLDGPEKVSGRAKYSADLKIPGALVGRILRSPYAHAEIIEVDVSAALALPGVKAVVTGEDCDMTYGVIPIAMNEFPIARDKVRYRGEPMAAVAAVDDATANEAIRLIRLKVKELPVYGTAGQSRAPDAIAIHEDKPNNVDREVHTEFGDTAAAMAEADLVREETYTCAEVCQVQMEPNACVAEYDPLADRLTLHTCSQVPFYVHLMLERCLDMEAARIRVIKPFVGGGFGHRTETLNFEIICSLLARAAGGAVRLVLTREENFITHRGRPRTEVSLKIGMKTDGTITATECEVTQLGGAYAGYGVVTILYSGALLNAIYDIPAVKYSGYRVFANLPPCGAMRGHGIVDVRHSFECLLDTMAEELGLDPFAVRRRNLLDKPDFTGFTINDLMVKSYGLPECLDKVEKASGWRQRAGKMPPGRGLGIACSHYVSGAAKPVHWTGEPHAVVILKLDFDASVSLLTGAADIGQGSSTILAQAAAEVLSIDIGRIRVVANDSAVTPKDNGSYSSRVTFMVGNACIEAAKELRRILVEAAAEKLEAKPEDIEVLEETFRVQGSQDPGLSFKEVTRAALVESGTITAKGTFSTLKEAQGGKFRGAGVGPSMGYSYTAQVVEVSVDPVTAKVRVVKAWVAHDCGFAINPLSVEGQIEGSVWMGMGQALSEETRQIDGLPFHGHMLGYAVPSIVESPPIDVQIVESLDPNGPFGAKEAGEASLISFIPALANAVYDATGVRMTELPITPDRLLAALTKAEKQASKQAAAGGS